LLQLCPYDAGVDFLRAGEDRKAAVRAEARGSMKEQLFYQAIHEGFDTRISLVAGKITGNFLKFPAISSP
jgi:hypothetical protein